MFCSFFFFFFFVSVNLIKKRGAIILVLHIFKSHFLALDSSESADNICMDTKPLQKDCSLRAELAAGFNVIGTEIHNQQHSH